MGNGGILVDPGIDLLGSVDQLRLGKVQSDELAVIGRIAARRQPRPHVILLVGSEREKQNKLLFLFTGQAHDRGVGLHLPVLSIHGFARDAEKVFFVIEDLGILHVIGGVHPCLNNEQVLGIADVGPKIFGHRLQRLHKARKYFGVGQDDGIILAAKVKIHCPVISVYHCLDRVAHVVPQFSCRFRVWVAVRGRIAVDNPDQTTLSGNDQIGIPIESDKRGNFFNPLLNLPVVKDAALPGNIVGEGDPQGCVAGRKEELTPDGMDRHAPLAHIVRINVLIAGGIVQFLCLGLDEDIIVGQLTIIDLRTGNFNRPIRDRRNVLDEKLRQALRGNLIDRAKDNAIAVGIGEMLVDPDAAR